MGKQIRKGKKGVPTWDQESVGGTDQVEGKLPRNWRREEVNGHHEKNTDAIQTSAEVTMERVLYLWSPDLSSDPTSAHCYLYDLGQVSLSQFLHL